MPLRRLTRVRSFSHLTGLFIVNSKKRFEITCISFLELIVTKQELTTAQNAVGSYHLVYSYSAGYIRNADSFNSTEVPLGVKSRKFKTEYQKDVGDQTAMKPKWIRHMRTCMTIGGRSEYY